MDTRRMAGWLSSACLFVSLSACSGINGSSWLPDFEFLKYFSGDKGRLLAIFLIVVGVVVSIVVPAYLKHSTAVEIDWNKTTVKLAELKLRATEAKRRKQEPGLFDE